jgi:hypothetical protein
MRILQRSPVRSTFFAAACILALSASADDRSRTTKTLPDLRGTKITLTSPTVVSFDVINEGNGHSGIFFVRLELKDANGVIRKTVNEHHPSLAPGEQATFHIGTSVPQGGSVEMTVDPTNRIMERNEANNVIKRAGPAKSTSSEKTPPPTEKKKPEPVGDLAAVAINFVPKDGKTIIAADIRNMDARVFCCSRKARLERISLDADGARIGREVLTEEVISDMRANEVVALVVPMPKHFPKAKKYVYRLILERVSGDPDASNDRFEKSVTLAAL